MNEDKNNNKDIDLSGALKDTPDSQNGYRAIKYYHESNAPKIIQWTINLSGGLVKNEKQAGYVLFGFVAIAIIIALFLFFNGNKQTTTPPESYTNKPQFLPNQ